MYFLKFYYPLYKSPNKKYDLETELMKSLAREITAEIDAEIMAALGIGNLKYIQTIPKSSNIVFCPFDLMKDNNENI